MKILGTICKVVLAGILAIAILCVVFAPYVFTPVHKSNPLGNTDYIWPSGGVWYKMTEGISHGKFDANGYNNPSVVENPDILLLGSSHMEALDVNQDQSTAYVLDQLLPESSVYNLGISGHHFLKVCKYLPATLALYPNEPEFIIIETDDIRFSPEDIDTLLQGTIEYTQSFDSGVIAALQRFPFLRLMYLQSDDLLELMLPKSEADTPEQPTIVTEAAYEALFGYIRQVTANCNSKIIIVYHPNGQLQPDGSVSFREPDQSKALFAKKCEESGIRFVDMAPAFGELYAQSHKLPHGFITGRIGYGHLNADGHRCVAEELANAIRQMRQEEMICK